MSESVRQQKFARLIQKELSQIFQIDKRGILDKEFVTITEVKVSPDLALARVYVSMMLVKNKQQTLDRITSHKSEIRKALGDQIRKQARIIPDLVFYIDEVEENAQRIESLINSLHIPPADDTKENEN